jgi:hypothetical protein
MTQLDKLKKLIQRKQGVMSWEIAQKLPSVTPHRRLFDLKEQGWTILHKTCHDGQKIYFGTPPKS